MTAQNADKFRYEGEEYQLVGINGTELYTPEDLGLEPKPQGRDLSIELDEKMGFFAP